MSNDKMNNIRSDAAMLGLLGESVKALIEYIRAELKMEYHTQVKDLTYSICSLEARAERLTKRVSLKKKDLQTVMAKKTIDAPFVWVFIKVQLAILDLRIRRLEKTSDNAKSELVQHQEEMYTETKRLEKEIQMYFALGERFNH